MEKVPIINQQNHMQMRVLYKNILDFCLKLSTHPIFTKSDFFFFLTLSINKKKEKKTLKHFNRVKKKINQLKIAIVL